MLAHVFPGYRPRKEPQVDPSNILTRRQAQTAAQAAATPATATDLGVEVVRRTDLIPVETAAGAATTTPTDTAAETEAAQNTTPIITGAGAGRPMSPAAAATTMTITETAAASTSGAAPTKEIGALPTARATPLTIGATLAAGATAPAAGDAAEITTATAVTRGTARALVDEAAAPAKGQPPKVNTRVGTALSKLGNCIPK
jgi:hypothetical protein